MGKRVTFWLAYFCLIGVCLAQFTGTDSRTRKDYSGGFGPQSNVKASAGAPSFAYSGATPTPTPTATATPTATPTASPADYPHVADANARLSIDPTGKVAGYQVIQDDDGLTYEFQGDGADAGAGLWVSGAGTSGYNGAYTFDGSETYAQIGGGGNNCNFNGGPWRFNNSGNSYVTPDTVTYAWQATTWVSGGFEVSDPPPSVLRNPIASENNWMAIP